MYNPDYILTDLELLAKYGLKPYSNREELSIQVTLLYCLKNGYSLNLDDDVSRQVSFFRELMKVLPENLVKVLGISVMRAHRFYDPEIVMNVYNASKKTNFLDTPEYKQVLVALIQNSEPFILNGCCNFKQTLFLAEILKDNHCDVLDYDEKKYPFLRALLSDKVTLNYSLDDVTYQEDSFYHFLIDELSAPLGIYPPNEAERAESSIMSMFYNIDGLACSTEEYLETIGGGAIEDYDVESEEILDDDCGWGYNFIILQPDEFSQTFFRFLDRYEYYDRILVPYLKEWQNTSSKEREIRSCIEERMLSQVISDGKDTYVLLHGWGDDMVRFKSFCNGKIVDFHNIPSGENGVPYEDIVENQYSLNPYLYMVTECDENHELVRLGDICSIDEEQFEDFLTSSKSLVLLPEYSFAKDLTDIYRNMETKREYVVEFPYDVNRSIYCGPHIHVTTNGEYILSNATGYYACPDRKNWALSLNKPEVSIEYLTYVLLNSACFNEFLASEPSSQILLNKKVAILRNYKEQEDVVLKFKIHYSAIVKTSHVYNVALLVPKCPDWTKTTMEECWYLKLQEFEHVIGDGGLLDILDKGQESLDAVIIDAVVDSVRDRYKGLRNLMAKVQGRNIPVYLYTDVDDEFLQDDLSEQEYQYFKEGRSFKPSDETAIDALVRNLRNELDGQDNKIARRRGEYIREFEAAEWLEQKFPKLNIVSALTFSLSQPNKSFNTLRGVLNSLYKAIMYEISNGSGLDQIKSVGMLPQLLRDGKYAHENQIVFIVKRDIMPLPLAVSLCYASQIVNGGSHEEDVEKMDVKGYLSHIRSEHLAHSVIRIVMDFILWLYEVNFEFDGFCESADLNELVSKTYSGVLQQAGLNEYFCETEEGRIHVFVKGKARLGAEIEITQVKHETKLRDKYKWITHTWNYKKENE